MIIKIKDLKNILDKLPMQEDMILCFDDVNGFKIKNTNVDFSLFENELNNVSTLEEYFSVSDIQKHLKISKPTVLKLLKDNQIEILDINTFKIKKSDYLTLLTKYYL